MDNLRIEEIVDVINNGSSNPDVWIENAKLYGKIVEMSEKLA